jgi:hypothetical protein
VVNPAAPLISIYFCKRVSVRITTNKEAAMKGPTVALLISALSLAACGGAADKGGGETTTPKDEAGPPAAGAEPEIITSLDDGDAEHRWVVFDFTADQKEDYDRQLEENRRTGGYEVTIEFTPAQLEAIRRVCPECEETFITWDADCIFGSRVGLRFDDAGKIIEPEPPRTSR